MDAAKTGGYLAMLRKTKGMTQQAAAEQLGVSNKTVSKWESGGGFPDITVLPALAELYGVTADDILAGETLGERRSLWKEETQARKKRLLLRLRTRFDVCFVLSLALAAVAFFGIPYVSLAALPLSAAALWMGCVLAMHPIRCGVVEAGTELWQNLFRKLLAASLVQWWALLRMLRLGEQKMDWEAMTVRGVYDSWKPVLFCVGALLLLVVLARGLRRTAGKEARLLPEGWRQVAPWLLWSLLFLGLWHAADERFQEALVPWVKRYGEGVLTDSRFDELWPKLKAKRDAELLPWLRARQAAAAAGGVSGLGLLTFQLRGLLSRKKQRNGLADPQK